MVVRWARIKSDNSTKRVVYTLCAAVENGHPAPEESQSIFPFQLGRIEEKYLTVNVRTLREFHQGLFWVLVDNNLDKLDIDAAVRSRIEQEVSLKIPRPPEEWALWGVICVPKFDSKPC